MGYYLRWWTTKKEGTMPYPGYTIQFKAGDIEQTIEEEEEEEDY